jgi:hypothetical protein
MTATALAAVVAASVPVPRAGAQPAAVSPRSAGRQVHAATLDARGTVLGHAWRAENSPFPQARLRLRNVETGRTIATTVADDRGQFTFDHVPPGAYVVELVDDTDRVLAVGPLFGVSQEETVTTLVRLATRSPWTSNVFRNAAAAAIAAASTLGITASGSSGLPVSPQ